MRVIVGRRLSKNDLSFYFTIAPLTSIAAPLISAFIAQESYTLDLILIFTLVVTLTFIILKIKFLVSESKSDKIGSVKAYIKNRKALTLPLLIAVIRFIFGTSFLYIPYILSK